MRDVKGRCTILSGSFGKCRSTVLAALVCLCILAPEVVQANEIQLPQTITKVWYRDSSKRGITMIKPFAIAGDLTVSEEMWELTGGKKSISIPVPSIRMVWLGKMPGDVDSMWAVLAYEHNGELRFAGFRDGRKMGYGQSTRRIFQTMKSCLRQTDSGPYKLPEGFSVFDQIAAQFVLAIPQDWHTHIDSTVYSGGRLRQGLMVFSEEKIGGPTGTPAHAALDRLHRGDLNAFYVKRGVALKGMTCKGFSKKGQERLEKLVREDPIFAPGHELLEPMTVEPETVAWCNGFRFRAQVRQADATISVLDLRVVANDNGLFMVGRRHRPDTDDAYRAVFETAIDSVAFAGFK
jgi:hypothetical protein